MRFPLLSRWEKDAFLVAGGNGVAQAIAAVSMPILTRLYAPTDFGIFALYVSVYGVALVASSLRYQQAILLPREEKAATGLLALSIALIGPYIIATSVGAIFLIRMTDWAPALYPLAWILPLSLAAGGAAEALSYWPLRREQYRLLASTRVSQMGGIVAGQLVLGIAGLGPAGLVLGDLLGRIVEAARYLGNSVLRKTPSLPRQSLGNMLKQAERYRRFPFLALPASVVSALGTYLPPVIVATFFGAEATGNFFFAWKVVAIPVALVGTSLGQAFAGHGARTLRTDGIGLRAQVRSASRRLLVVALVPAILMVVLGPTAFRIVFGPDWTQAGSLAAVMAPALVALTVSAPFGYLLVLLQKQELQLAWDSFRVTFTVLAMTVTAIKFESLEATTLAFALATVASAVLLLVFIDHSLSAEPSAAP